jgi:uncharacterized membrane protein
VKTKLQKNDPITKLSVIVMIVIVIMAISNGILHVNLYELFPAWIKNLIETAVVFYIAYIVNEHFETTTRRIIREELDARFGEAQWGTRN